STLGDQHHAVIGGLDIGQQFLLQFLIVEVDMHMGEDRAFRPHALDPGQRLIDAEMARMRGVAERIDDPYIEIAQISQRLLRKIAHVRRIGDTAEAEAERLAGAVDLPEWQRLDHPARALDHHRDAGGQLMLVQDWRIVAAGKRLEAIREARAELIACYLVEIDLDAPMTVISDHAQIIDAMGMVGVVVSIEHAVEPTDPKIEQLLPQIGWRVHENTRRAGIARLLHQKRAPPAPVLRVVGIASAPMIADARHPARGSAAENRDFQVHAALALNAERGTLLNSLKKFSVVAVAISSALKPRVAASLAAVCTT